MKLDNPLLVRSEYASEERLAKRNEIFRALVSGDSPEELAFQAVAEARPQRIVDIGCGPGEVTQRFLDELRAEVCAVDISPRREPREPLSFNHENGAAALARRFEAVERRNVAATLTFLSTESIREFVAATIDRAHLAPRVPEINEPLRATTRHANFVAERPR